jgi:non-ribosomal peptide synthetase component F
MTDSPHHGSIPEMVSSAAARMPTHTALVQQHRRVPYGSLNGRANQIARYLLSLGIKPEDRIGLWMGRSIEFCIGALGILKAGAAYVPLDPSYPEARRTSIAKDAGLRLILTDAVAISPFRRSRWKRLRLPRRAWPNQNKPVSIRTNWRM